MSLRDDLIRINDSLSSTLHGINSLLPFEVENLKNTPPVIEEAIRSARREGEESGYSTGYNEGRENAETIIVDISNEAIEKYTAPAEDWSNLPSKIDEVYGVGTHDGKISVLESSKYMRGNAEGELVTLRDVSPVRHNVGVAVNRKNLLSVGTVVVNESKDLIKRTDTPLPAGTYTFSTKVINSTDTDNANNQSGIYFGFADGTYEMKTFARNKRVSVTYTATQPIVQITVYAGANYPQSVGDTATYEYCQLEVGTTATPYSPYIDDTSDVKVRVMGKNLLSCGTVEVNEMETVLKKTDAPLPAGTYTFSATIESTDTNSSSNESGVGFELADGTVEMKMMKRNIRASVTFKTTQMVVQIHIYAGMNYPQSVGDTATYVDCQLEVGTTATEYEPYKAPVEYEQGEEIPSIYPSMTVTTDTDGALVSVEYLRDIDAYINNLTGASAVMTLEEPMEEE